VRQRSRPGSRPERNQPGGCQRAPRPQGAAQQFSECMQHLRQRRAGRRAGWRGATCCAAPAAQACHSPQPPAALPCLQALAATYDAGYNAKYAPSGYTADKVGDVTGGSSQQSIVCDTSWRPLRGARMARRPAGTQPAGCWRAPQPPLPALRMQHEHPGCGYQA